MWNVKVNIIMHHLQAFKLIKIVKITLVKLNPYPAETESDKLLPPV